MSVTLDLMRHGEPVGGRKYRGQIDDPCRKKAGHRCTQPWAIRLHGRELYRLLVALPRVFRGDG